MPNNRQIPIKPFQSTNQPQLKFHRRALERLDLLLLAVESLDLNGSQAMIWTSKELGLEEQFSNSVDLWKCRSHNPLRKVARRGIPTTKESAALITLLCKMSERLYPIIRQLLSSREPDEINKKRWSQFNERFTDLIQERMNIRRGAVQKLLQADSFDKLSRDLIISLSLSVGYGGENRLRASLSDPKI